MKVQNSSTTALPAMKPTAATSMIAISRFFTKRIMAVLSCLSVNCPLVALNSRKGRMKSAPMINPAMAGGNQLMLSW